MEASVLQSQDWLEETNISPFSFFQELDSGFKAGTDIRDSLGQIPDLTGGEAKDPRKGQTYLRSLVQ